MRYHKDRGIQLMACLFKGADDSLAGFGIQIPGGFICQHDQRMVDQSTGDCGSLFFTPGYFGGILAADMRNAEDAAETVCLFSMLLSIRPLMIRGSMILSRTVRPSSSIKS